MAQVGPSRPLEQSQLIIADHRLHVTRPPKGWDVCIPMTTFDHTIWYIAISIHHGPPKPTFWEVLMVNNLVSRRPKNILFFWGAHGIWGVWSVSRPLKSLPTDAQVQQHLHDVRCLRATFWAFAAIRNDGPGPTPDRPCPTEMANETPPCKWRLP